MWAGKIESIHIADGAKMPMQSVDHVEAIAGVGLERDRYANGQGPFFKPEPDFELTLSDLVEAELAPRRRKLEEPRISTGSADLILF